MPPPLPHSHLWSRKPVREWGQSCEPMEKVMDVVAGSGKEGTVKWNSPSPSLPYILGWAEENMDVIPGLCTQEPSPSSSPVAGSLLVSSPSPLRVISLTSLSPFMARPSCPLSSTALLPFPFPSLIQVLFLPPLASSPYLSLLPLPASFCLFQWSPVLVYLPEGVLLPSITQTKHPEPPGLRVGI